MFENLTPIERQVITLMAGKADGIITLRELKDELFDTIGHRIMTIITATEPKMRKTGNPYHGNVLKLAYSQVRTGMDYQNAVNNQREREGADADFVAKSSWHEPVPSPTGGYSPFCRHKTTGEWYLRAAFDKHIAMRYVDRNTGVEIAKETLDPWLQENNSYEGQGLEKAVKFVTYKLGNILAYNANGQSRLVAA